MIKPMNNYHKMLCVKFIFGNSPRRQQNNLGMRIDNDPLSPTTSTLHIRVVAQKRGSHLVDGVYMSVKDLI